MNAERIVAAARGWIGTPYVHQASLKGVGCDCLGLLRGVWREVVGSEPEAAPPYSPDWAEAAALNGLRLEPLAEAAARHLIPIAADGFSAGDVLLFRWRDGLPAKHCGIAATASSMVHAHEGAAVTEVPLGLWRRRIAYAFRFPTVS
jgi:NlpC/P60 family putative phage cell wall peptidase